jgi:hypothetical protein
MTPISETINAAILTVALEFSLKIRDIFKLTLTRVNLKKNEN